MKETWISVVCALKTEVNTKKMLKSVKKTLINFVNSNLILNFALTLFAGLSMVL